MLSPTIVLLLPFRTGTLSPNRSDFQYSLNVMSTGHAHRVDAPARSLQISSAHADQPVPDISVRRITGMQQASVHTPPNGFGAKPKSYLTT